jgi:hypothetical protein
MHSVLGRVYFDGMGKSSAPSKLSPRFNPKTPMPLAKKMADIARRGLLFFSGDLRILLLPRRRQRAYLKSLLRRRRLRSSQQLAISRNGNFSASPEGIRLKDAFESACRDVSRLSHRIREIEGMSGQRYRSFINNFVRSSPDARQLVEVRRSSIPILCQHRVGSIRQNRISLS